MKPFSSKSKSKKISISHDLVILSLEANVKTPLFESRHAHVFFAQGKKDKTFELITEKKFTNNAKYFVGRMWRRLKLTREMFVTKNSGLSLKERMEEMRKKEQIHKTKKNVYSF